MKQPLEGVRVLDLGTLTPGKYCTYILAAAGAEVIRIERPGSQTATLDDEDLILNQGKQSITLNLRTEPGRELLLTLAEKADIIIEGNRPGTADRNGFGYEAIRERNEGIIYLALSAYGATGPLSNSVGYDLIFLGLSGVLRALTGSDSIPANPGAYLADGTTGLSAACSLLLALYERERTGAGQFIDLSMFDSAFSMLAVSHGTRKPGADVETNTSDLAPTYNVYAAANGTSLVLSAIRPTSHNALFEALGEPQLADSKDSSTQHEFLTKTFAQRTATQWVAELAPLDIEVAVVNRPHEAFDHPQLQAREMLGKTDHPDAGEVQVIRPALLNPADRGNMSPAPTPGRDTVRILNSIGLSPDQLQHLQDEGVI